MWLKVFFLPEQPWGESTDKVRRVGILLRVWNDWQSQTKHWTYSRGVKCSSRNDQQLRHLFSKQWCMTAIPEKCLHAVEQVINQSSLCQSIILREFFAYLWWKACGVRGDDSTVTHLHLDASDVRREWLRRRRFLARFLKLDNGDRDRVDFRSPMIWLTCKFCLQRIICISVSWHVLFLSYDANIQCVIALRWVLTKRHHWQVNSIELSGYFDQVCSSVRVQRVCVFKQKRNRFYLSWVF